MMVKKFFSFLLAALCIVGAGLCVAMLVRAVQWLEWGRVILYSVCLAVCVECAVLILLNLKKKKED